jgi:ribonuclease P protein component
VLCETNVSSQQRQEKADAWLFEADVVKRGKGCAQTTEGEGEKKIGSIKVRCADRGFSRECRVLRAFEFRLAYDRGERKRTRHFSFCILRREGNSRLGISVSRRVGGAVVRNTIRRRIREFFRLHRTAMGLAGDVVVTGLASCGSISGSELEYELRKAFEVGSNGTSV